MRIARLLPLPLLLVAPALAAQNAVVRLSAPNATVAPGAALAVPVALDLSAAPGLPLASLTVRVTYDAARLTLQRVDAGTYGSVTSNAPQPGTATVTLFGTTPATASFTAATLRFVAGTATGATSVALAVQSAGSDQGQSLAARVQAGPALAVCVGTAGGEKWGDVNGDGQVDILDAQQIARAAVGLSVLDAARVARVGDVTGDGSVDILDAQQIARFAVGLPASARTGQATTAGGCAPATPVTPVAPPPTTPGFNLVLDGLSITQGVQRADNSVPLVRGRPMYLRALVRATGPLPPGAAVPDVHLRWYSSSGALIDTDTMRPRVTSVPTQRDDAGQGWQLLFVDAANNMSVVAELDPDQRVPESDRSDNVWPAGGVPMRMTSTRTPTLAVRFVPIVFSSNGDRGDVTAANVARYAADAQRMMPVSAFDVDVRATPYVTTLRPVTDDDDDPTWPELLKEIETLRTLEGGARYYYGVLAARYRQGTSGRGYTPATLRPTSAVGVDVATWPTSAPFTVAHELGHNLGRLHAPSPEAGCGKPGNVDPGFPYANGGTGALGFDVWTTAADARATGRYVTPTPLPAATWRDIMGYCPSSVKWISDYTYAGIVEFLTGRSTLAASMPAARAAGPTRVLVVTGTVDDRAITLDPVLESDGAPTAASPASPHRVRVLDDRGRVIADVAVDATPVADAPRATAHVVAAVPIPRDAEPARVELTDGARTAARAVRPARPFAPTVGPLGRGARIRWNADDYPAVVVRDAATRRIVTIARGGDVTLPGSAAVDLEASDGVRLRARRTLGRPR